MKKFLSVKDAGNPAKLVELALKYSENPLLDQELGRNKTLGLIFMNPSLRTRLSSEKAALNLGMQVMSMNAGQDGWALEMEDGAIMNGTTVEHIKDAAKVIGSYCDIIGLRSFPSLTDKQKDDSEFVMNKFLQACNKPLVSLESATRHPLQSLADLITIKKHAKTARPKVVLTWAPHVKALPQAVPNSFAEWMLAADLDLTITHPEGLELNPEFTEGAVITHNQQEALANADFVYVKNWSSYNDYGKPFANGDDWLLSEEKMKAANAGCIMHCLPVRRNVELPDELLDGTRSLIYEQALNRVWAAQAVLSTMIRSAEVKSTLNEDINIDKSTVQLL